jgi:hypothetical protein
MSNNLEQIKSRVSETKDQIEKSRDLSPEEKMAKAREFENVMSEISADLELLKSSATPQELKEIEAVEVEYKKLQEQLTVFKKELDDFQNQLKEDIFQDIKEDEDTDDKQKKENKKNWFWRQIEGLTSKDEWSSNPAKNVARIAWGFWAVWLWSKIIKWIGRLFKKKNNNESETKDIEKKPWYKKWRWMWLIWVWWFFGIKWLMDYFSNKVDKTDTSVDQVSDYEKLTEDQKNKYEKIWNCTNDFYSSIWNKEINMWYRDANYLWKISEDVKLKKWETPEKLAWVVPFCIDKDSENISKFLSERDLNVYLFSKNYKELKNKIKGWTVDRLESFLWPFANKLQSFEVFGMRPWKSLWENIQDWLNDDEEWRQKELDFFFRQYTKVLTYVNDRKTALEYQIAEKSIKARWYDGDSRPEDRKDQLDMIKDALSDKERFEKEIKDNEIYVSFLSSNLLWVWFILESNWLLNWDMSDLLSQEVIWPIDEESDDILKYDEDFKTTIIDKWIEEIDWWLSDWTKDDLIDTCDDLRDDMVDESWTWFLQENLEWISYACNMTDSNKDIFLKETWLDKFANKYTDTINEFREKIKNGTATKEDLEKLKKMSSEYLAFKKELNLAIYTLTQIRDDNPDRVGRFLNTIYKFFTGLAESFSNIFTWNWTKWDWINFWVGISVILWSIYIIKHPGRILLWTVNKTRQWITWVAWRPSLSSFWLKRKINSLSSFTDKKSFFQHYLFNWKINNKKKILRLADSQIWIRANTVEDLLKQLWVPNEYVDQVWKYRSNKNLRKLMLKQYVSSHANINDRLFRRKSSKVFNFDTDALRKIKAIDIVSDANLKYSKSINRLLRNMKSLDDLDKLELLISDQRFLSKIENLNRFQLKKISRSIGKVWFTVDWIDSIIGWSSNIDAATRTRFNQIIDDEILVMRWSSTSADSRIMKWKINQLENLKSSNKVTKEMADTFIKLESKWIKARHFPDISDRLKQDKKLIQALDNWNFDEFSRLARANRSLKNTHKILWEFDSVLKRWWKYIDELADIIKGLWRVMRLL